MQSQLLGGQEPWVTTPGCDGLLGRCGQRTEMSSTFAGWFHVVMSVTFHYYDKPLEIIKLKGGSICLMVPEALVNSWLAPLLLGLKSGTGSQWSRRDVHITVSRKQSLEASHPLQGHTPTHPTFSHKPQLLKVTPNLRDTRREKEGPCLQLHQDSSL